MLQDSSIPWIVLLVLLFFRLVFVEGGGRLLTPSGRGSLRRSISEEVPDDENNIDNCEWGAGVITRQYFVGETVDVEVQLPQSVSGSFQLHLCPNPNNSSEECFSHHPLYLATTNTTTYHPRLGDKVVKLKYRLPPNLNCTHCVLQWRYITDHKISFEELRACADISIQSEHSADSEHAIQSEETIPEVTTIKSTVSIVVFDAVESTVTELPIVATTVDILDKVESIKFIHESKQTTIQTESSAADATTIAPSVAVIENKTETTEPPLTTIANGEIITEQDLIKLNELEETTVKSGIITEQSDLVANSREVTAKPGVMQIRILDISSDEESPVYTIAPERITPGYSLIRDTISQPPLNSETNQEDANVDYEISRTKPTTISEYLISSSPASITSVTARAALQTTDRISELTTVTTARVLVTTSTSIKTSTTTKSITTESTTPQFSFGIPIFISPEKVDKSTTQNNLVMIAKTTTTTKKTTTTESTTPSTTTAKSTTLSSTNPESLIPPTTTIRSTTHRMLVQTFPPKPFSNSKAVSTAINSISIIETPKKVLKEKDLNPEPHTGSTTNHTVIYQVYSHGPSLGYGLFLSVPAAIIFFGSLFLFYLKKNAEVTRAQKTLKTAPTGSTIYHSVPKEDTEAGEEDSSQLANITSTTSMCMSEHSHTPTPTIMSPEYALMPDVVPSCVRASQRRRLDISVDESCYPGNSLPNLSQVINIPIEETYSETPVVQYSSLNELNSTENSPKPCGGENPRKRWQSDDLEAKEGKVEGWNIIKKDLCSERQRWKSEDWEKDQSFIAMLAKRLEHVDSSAEITEL